MLYLVKTLITHVKDDKTETFVCEYPEKEFLFEGREEYVKLLVEQFGCEKIQDEYGTYLRHLDYEPITIKNTFPKELNRKNRTNWKYDETEKRYIPVNYGLALHEMLEGD